MNNTPIFIMHSQIPRIPARYLSMPFIFMTTTTNFQLFPFPLSASVFCFSFPFLFSVSSVSTCPLENGVTKLYESRFVYKVARFKYLFVHDVIWCKPPHIGMYVIPAGPPPPPPGPIIGIYFTTHLMGLNGRLQT